MDAADFTVATRSKRPAEEGEESDAKKRTILIDEEEYQKLVRNYEILESDYKNVSYRLMMNDVDLALTKEYFAEIKKEMQQVKERILPQIDGTVINLNVGGTKMTTMLSTLRTVPGSMLANIFSGQFPVPTDKEGNIFIDRDPALFKKILEYLRDIKSRKRINVSDEVFLHELEFYGLSDEILGTERILVFCGQENDSTLNSVECYYPKLNKWHIITKMPQARRRSGVCIDSKKNIYIIGGHNGHRQQDSVLVYTPEEDTWATMAPIKFFRTAIGSTIAKDIIFVTGGYHVTNTVRTVECFDLKNKSKTNNWFEIKPLQTGRLGHATVTIGDCIYVIGGWNSVDHFNSCEKLTIKEPLTEQNWEPIQPMLSARSELTAVALNGKIYAIGGYDGNNFLNSVEVYDPETNVWSPVAPMFNARGWPAATVSKGKIYVTGGRLKPAGIMLPVAEVYDPMTNNWTILESMVTPRDGHAAVSYSV